MLTLIQSICRMENMKEGMIMENMPKKITSIEGSNIFEVNNTSKFTYTLNKETDEAIKVPIILSCTYTLYRPSKSFTIIDDSRDFVNGYKVVQTANKEYGYVREEDNALLPFRYDIATDFNEYGYAMVGKNAHVSWIDKKFRYFNAEKEEFTEENEIGYNTFYGFLGVSDFSKGEYPLSKIYRFGYDNTVSYLGTDGKIKNFYNFDGNIIRNDVSNKNFSCYSENFNDKGYAKANKGELILLSSGYLLSIKDLIRFCEEKGFLDTIILDTISSRIDKQEQAYTNFLKAVEEKTITFADNLSKINSLITEYGIAGIEFRNEELISKYGKEVYERAREDDIYSKRKLSYLVIENQLASSVIDLNLLESILAQRGISSYIDYENNVFHYNVNKHVKRKRYS